LLVNCGIKPVKLQPVDAFSRTVWLEGGFARVRSDLTALGWRRTNSNKLTHISVWREIAHNPEYRDPGFALVFEDDVQLNEKLRNVEVVPMIYEAARLAQDGPGVFYLGICARSCDASAASTKDGHQYGRCVGRCAHAYGVLVARATWLWEELEAVTLPPSPEDAFYADIYLHYGHLALARGNSSLWPVVAGIDLHASRTPHDHFGMFFQHREAFPSEILTP
jgi:hypothetical protein